MELILEIYCDFKVGKIMKLSKVKLCGFKSFKDETTIEIDDLTTIIGRNSSGKTSFFLFIVKNFWRKWT